MEGATMARGAILCWLAVAGFLSLAAPLLAGPPLVTDDPGTPGVNSYEVNVSDEVIKMPGLLEIAAPYVDLNYGRLSNDQFKLELPLVNFVDTDIGPPHAGVGDILMGYKYRFIEEDEWGFSASVYPQLIVPTGNVQLGLGEGLTEMPETMQISKHFFDKKLFVYAQAGYWICLNGSRYNAFDYGLAAEWEVNKKLALMGEVGGMDFPDHGFPDNPFFNVGFGYKFSDHVALIGSAGRCFRDSDIFVPEFTSYLGFQFTGGFNKDKKGEESGNPNPAGEKKEE
jgi:hypothetical protein